MFGHLEPFSPAMLKELYGDLKSYEAKVREATMIHVEKGYVLKEEAELIIAQAVKDAKERGLN